MPLSSASVACLGMQVASSESGEREPVFRLVQMETYLAEYERAAVDESTSQLVAVLH